MTVLLAAPGVAEVLPHQQEQSKKKLLAIDEEERLVRVRHAYESLFRTMVHPALTLSVLQDRIVRKCWPFIEIIAKRLWKSLPRCSDNKIQRDDLVSEGLIGLLQATNSFDKSKKTKFKSHAWRRIRGQMIDFLRHEDLVARSPRENEKKLDRYEACWHASCEYGPHGRENFYNFLREILLHGSFLEIIQVLHMIPELDRYVQKNGFDSLPKHIAELAEGLNLPNLHYLRSGEMRGLSEKVEYHGSTAEELIDARFVRERVFAIFPQPHHRLIVMLYWGEGLTQPQIGQAVGCDGSRVSQYVHRVIVPALRAVFKSQIDARWVYQGR